jgi:hypothetical protein
MAELDLKIKDHEGDVDQLEHLRLAAKRLRDLAAAVGPHLIDADWHRRRDIIRTVVPRIEIGREVIKIVFRGMPDARGSEPESVVVRVIAGVKELRLHASGNIHPGVVSGFGAEQSANNS